MYKYSPSAKGFFLEAVHGANIPGDAFAVDEATYQAMKAGNAQGKEIVASKGVLSLRDPAPVVPQCVTMRQAQLALLDRDLLDDVEAAISALPSAEKKRAQIEWRAATVDRSSALLAQLAPGLGLTDADLDALFTHAATL